MTYTAPQIRAMVAHIETCTECGDDAETPGVGEQRDSG
ncbi:hypothetical protein HDA43_006830 [Streptosporangium sandarakinum]|uniref:Uncharacterized protein n=1 Tax=Streptosporangium sandarakinum TaxID=1260955 RepID=A0A852VAM6_9ACTN|nr:hypothetical protein [Streptosporangium sandarakinum]